jgi:hypothetical protein
MKKPKVRLRITRIVYGLWSTHTQYWATICAVDGHENMNYIGKAWQTEVYLGVTKP